MDFILQTEAGGPRDSAGAFIARSCPDLNCNGSLVWDGETWSCDGLTYDREDGPLVACTHSAPAFRSLAPQAEAGEPG